MKRLYAIVSVLSISLLFSSCASLYINSGKTAYEEMNYNESIELLNKGLDKKEDFDGRMMLAESYMRTSQYSAAANSYGIASIEPKMTDKDRIEYGKALMADQKHDKALELFEAILSRDQGNKVVTSLASACRNINDLKSDSSLFTVSPLDLGSMKSIYAPIAYEEGMIVSGEKANSTSKDPYTGWSYTDLYYVKKEGDNWGSPKAITALNGNYHDGIAALPENGQTIYFTRSNYDGSRLKADDNNVSNTQIFYSNKLNDGSWTEPKELPLNEDNAMFAHPTISPDGKTIFFSSDKQGGFGGMDIYMSTLNETNWSSPVNLGPNVNTSGDEVFPHLMSGDTLYFSSDSHTGIGGLDILYTVNRGGEWSQPYHLSYPINSASDDFGISFTESNKSGYLSSNRLGADRVYAFEMHNPDLMIEGLVVSKDEMLPLENAKITITNITDGTEEVIYPDENGEFSYKLQPGKNYKVKVEDDNYFAQSKDISTIGKTSSEKIPLVFEMEELIVSDTGNNQDKTDGNDKLNSDGEYTYAVPNIYWDYNKWDIRPDAEPYLNQLVDKFKNNPNLKVEIRSHCDCRGSHPFNDALSNKRAKAVVDYVIAKGVNRSMLISKGYGKRKLLNGCKIGVECTEAEHQENRRTEFIVLSK